MHLYSHQNVADQFYGEAEMTFPNSPIPVANESEMVSVRYVTEFQQRSLETVERQVVDLAAGYFDGLGMSSDELIKEHEEAAKRGF